VKTDKNSMLKAAMFSHKNIYIAIVIC